MIFVKGYGQMCNNWLQYAHIYAWGLENGVKTVSMRFSYKYKYFKLSELPYHNFATYLLAKFLIKTKLIKCLWLQHPKYSTDENILRMLRNTPTIAADGWAFRHPALFDKYHNEIKRLFAFRHKKIAAKEAWMKSLPEADIRLGIHIRRGDYAKWQGGLYYFDDRIYAEMIRRFSELHNGKSIQVFIATNDPKTDVELIKRISGTDCIYMSAGNPGEDLFVLSECQYIMGPKSTFSLVASFYNDASLHWIESKDDKITEESFRKFDDVFMDV